MWSTLFYNFVFLKEKKLTETLHCLNHQNTPYSSHQSNKSKSHGYFERTRVIRYSLHYINEASASLKVKKKVNEFKDFFFLKKTEITLQLTPSHEATSKTSLS